MKIPFLDFEKRNHDIRGEILSTFEEFFDSKWYVLGERLRSFELAFAQYSNVDYCVGVSTGLDAIRLSLEALDIGNDDEVIVPSNTYIATVLAVTAIGATPIFVEPDPYTYNIDPSKIKSAITESTRCIIPVHLYGQPCEMDLIMEISNEYNLFVVEDNAQSQGATFNGRKTGSFGSVNATSHYPGKNLGALGEAGSITTNRIDLKDKVMALRNYGSSEKYVNRYLGYNNRMDEAQAAFLSIMLNYLDQWNSERSKIAEKYTNTLSTIEEVIKPRIHTSANSVWHQYVIRTNERDELQKYLSLNGIGTLIHYPIPPYLQECYAYLGYKRGDFPIAEMLSDTMLSLPIYPGLGDQKIEYILNKIIAFYSK